MLKSKNLRRTWICLISVFVVMALSLSFSFAESAGTYTTSVSPQYRNPLTGAIEDSGGEEKEALGQGMAQSTVSGVGLVSGNVYATYRINNASAMSSISFSTSAGGGFYGVSAVNTNTVGNSADYRIKVPYAGAPVKCALYVAPMGREVIFFMTSAGLTPGQGDFVSTIDTSVQAQASQGSESAKAEEAKKTDDKKTEEAKKAEDKKKDSTKKNSKNAKASDSKDKKDSKAKVSNKTQSTQNKRYVVYGALVVVIILAAVGTFGYKKFIKK